MTSWNGADERRRCLEVAWLLVDFIQGGGKRRSAIVGSACRPTISIMNENSLFTRWAPSQPTAHVVPAVYQKLF
jgi:hypothetical protein